VKRDHVIVADGVVKRFGSAFAFGDVTVMCD